MPSDRRGPASCGMSTARSWMPPTASCAGSRSPSSTSASGAHPRRARALDRSADVRVVPGHRRHDARRGRRGGLVLPHARQGRRLHDGRQALRRRRRADPGCRGRRHPAGDRELEARDAGRRPHGPLRPVALLHRDRRRDPRRAHAQRQGRHRRRGAAAARRAPASTRAGPCSSATATTMSRAAPSTACR